MAVVMLLEEGTPVGILIVIARKRSVGVKIDQHVIFSGIEALLQAHRLERFWQPLC